VLWNIQNQFAFENEHSSYYLFITQAYSVNGNELKEIWYAAVCQKCRSHLRILGARMVTWSKFRSKGPQILGATITKIQSPWRPDVRDMCTPALLWLETCGSVLVEAWFYYVVCRCCWTTPKFRIRVKENKKTSTIKIGMIWEDKIGEQEDRLPVLGAYVI
jgi:hypothetical protein